MYQYHRLLNDILVNGVRQKNRTGIDTIMLPGAMMKFDLRQGFPAITTKKLAFDGAKGELLGFLKAVTTANRFAELGCKWWFDNANKNEAWLTNPNRLGEDDLGLIYGAQWRGWWSLADGVHIDQVERAITDIRNNPTSRRIIINGWNVGELSQMALVPCHVLYQFIVDQQRGVLHLCMYQRSCDMFLGVPMNIATSAMMLEIFAKATGLQAGEFTHFLADAHIYENHLQQVEEQLNRKPLPLPKLHIDVPAEALQAMSGAEICDYLQPHHITLVDYQSHDAIKAPMAI